MSERVCTNCIFCKQADYGYSNYTVEGTTASCLFDLVGDFETTAYPNAQEKAGQDAAREFASTCKAFREGTGLYIDCDREDQDVNISAWIEQYVK